MGRTSGLARTTRGAAKGAILSIIALLLILLGGGFFAVSSAPGSAADQELIEATRNESLAGVEQALGHGANVNFKMGRSLLSRWTGNEFDYDEGMTALHYAAQMGNLPIVKLLIDRGANLNAQNSAGTTPLMLAASQNQKKVCQLFFDKKADLRIKNKQGKEAKDFAKMRNRVESYEMEKMFARELGEPPPPPPHVPNN